MITYRDTKGSNLTPDEVDANFRDLAAAKIDPTQFAKDAFFEKANGVYIPLLAPNSFDNTTGNATNGLVLHSSGGVRSATSGADAGGALYLPQSIDPSKPFRVAILIEVNDAQEIGIYLQHNEGDYRSGVAWSGISTSKLNMDVGGESVINSFGSTDGGGTGIPAGTKLWLTAASDGVNGVVCAVFPDEAPTGMIIGSQSYAPPYDRVIRGSNTAMNYQSPGSGFNVFGGNGTQFKHRLVKLTVGIKSATSRIIGLWINQGLGGPIDSRLTPPAVLSTNILQDTTGLVLIPKQQGTKPVDIVMINHPNNYTTWDTYRGTDPRASAMLGKLFAAGYVIFGLNGVYNSTPDSAEATASNWGAPTGLKYRKAQWQFVRENIPGTRYIYEIGLSMGFLNSLRLASQYPSQIRGVVGIGGVCDLKDCYDNRGFDLIINKAYAKWYVSLKSATGINPQSFAVVNANRAIGQTSIAIDGLPYALPTGTVLSLRTGTGQATITLTAAAAVNATTLTVTALTTAITNGAVYDVSSYFTQISYGYSAPEELYYKTPYIWRDIYNNATAYAINNVVGIPAENVNAGNFQFVDPSANPNQFAKIPIKIWHGSADNLIPIAQAQSLTTAINAVGGNASLVTVAGGTHLSDDTFDGDGIVAFFNSLSV